ncbi:hypothetical protein [Microbulbifer sp. JMSA008]|uniref:hypothetical protein n=1 Tax=Microbulbifer sp. JMSA008 TaxID=3243373 RepID=UPI004039D9EF
MSGFTSVEKRRAEVGKTKRREVTKWIVVVDDEDISLGSTVTPDSPAEVNLIYPLLNVTYENKKINA